MEKKEHRNKYKVGVADYLFCILKKWNEIDLKLNKIYKGNNLYA